MIHTHENIVRIKAVYNLLGDLKDKVVFVGGATVSLYAQRETTEIRETKDVDVLVEIASYSIRIRTLKSGSVRMQGFILLLPLV